MEHRWGKRKTVLLSILVHREGDLSLEGKILNINRDGVYIHTSAHNIKKGLVVYLETFKKCKIQGWVVHVDKTGFGVMFVSSIDCMDEKHEGEVSGRCSNCLQNYNANDDAQSVQKIS